MKTQIRVERSLGDAKKRTSEAMALAKMLLAKDPRYSPTLNSPALVEPRWRFLSPDLEVNWFTGRGAIMKAHSQEGVAVREILTRHGVEGELETLTVLLVDGGKQGQWEFASNAVTMDWSLGSGAKLTVLGDRLAHGRQGSSS